jgi:hypothetical protein
MCLTWTTDPLESLTAADLAIGIAVAAGVPVNVNAKAQAAIPIHKSFFIHSSLEPRRRGRGRMRMNPKSSGIVCEKIHR